MASASVVKSGIEQTRDGHINLSGKVNFDTVSKLYKQIDLATSQSYVQIDFAGVEAVDSSAIALCLALIENARERNIDIYFVNFPEQMKRLIQVNQVQELFSLE